MVVHVVIIWRIEMQNWWTVTSLMMAAMEVIRQMPIKKSNV